MAMKIMLIRHGEKPPNNNSVHGVSENGEHDSNELTVRGWQRAGALIRFFSPYNAKFPNAALATPTTIFAAAAAKTKSLRSQHTVQPLAQFLNKNVDIRFGTGDEDKLVQAISGASGVVLVAWEHDAIPEIAAAIVGNQKTCPKKWPDPRFDLVWVLDQRPGAAWALTQVPQLVLPGDREDIVELVMTG